MSEQLAQLLRTLPLAQWWRGKPTNEQIVYGALALAAAATIAWLALWRPLADWQAQAGQRLENAHRLFDWISANEAGARMVAHGAQQGSAVDADAIIPSVSHGADALGVRLSRLQPESGGGVTVTLEQQPFDQVVRLIVRLSDNNGIVVARASMDTHRTLGLVNAQLRFENASRRAAE